MWYILSGKDFEKKRKAFEALLKRFSQYEVTSVSEEECTRDFFLSRVGARDLFGKSYVFVFRGALEDTGRRAAFQEHLGEVQASENVFIFQENDLSSTERKPFSKYTDQLLLFPVQEKESVKSFSIFTFVDAFSSRDKKGAWVLLQEAFREAVDPVDIVNMVTWSLKNMNMVYGKKGTPSEIEASGMKPFVFKKSLTASKKWDEYSLKAALQNIVSLYHDSRRGEDLTRDLELFLLKTLS